MTKNRDIYQRDPDRIKLLNNGVVSVMDARSEDELKTLRFELEHFVCEGEYQRGLVRILQSYVNNIGNPEQPAAWVSGFFGSGKSHLVKMLRYLWVDYSFPEDGATARGLTDLPEDVQDLLKELSTWGKRQGGLHAAAGTLGAGTADSVRLALLGIVFKSVDLPESYPQARFCLWLKKNDLYDTLRGDVESAGRDFDRELNDLYVSPVIAQALLRADPEFAGSEKEAKAALREQFPKRSDISTDDFVSGMQDALEMEGQMPCTVVILDEVQQYIGEDSSRSYTVQEVVEACGKRFGDRVLFVGTGQTALTGTSALARLQGRFQVNVELSDYDVETVTRRVVLAKRPDRIAEVDKVLDESAAEIDRQLTGTKLRPRPEDRGLLVDDYPLLPVRRRFWEYVLRAVDKAGTVGQLRTQLRMVYEAIRQTADEPLGTVVPADFLFDQQAASMLQSGVLLREISETIRKQDDGTQDGRLRARVCALVFLIRKLPREAGADIGLRATPDALCDLLVANLPQGSAELRGKVPQLLDALTSEGILIKLEEEYSLQTRESNEWEQDFRNRRDSILNDITRITTRRGELLGTAVQDAANKINLRHGRSRQTRKTSLHFGSEAPGPTHGEIPVWIRDNWSTEEKSMLADAQAAGPNSPVLFTFIPKTKAEELRKALAEESAAQETLNARGSPTTSEGTEAREGMKTRLIEAERHRKSLVAEIMNGAKVFQGGGSEVFANSLPDKLQQAAEASLERLFPEFDDADDDRWPKVIERARKGAEHPLEPLVFNGKTEEHPVCSAVLSHVGSGKKGRDIRSYFAEPPYGWPRDAVDAALISLFETGHLRATSNGVALKSRHLDQAKISQTDFRTETATVSVQQRMALRKLCQAANVDCRPNEEDSAVPRLLEHVMALASDAGGDPPLPEKPDTQHIQELQSRTGNDQLAAVADGQDDLYKDLSRWQETAELAQKRRPAFEQLAKLMRHAEGHDFAAEIQPQYQAIIDERSLLAKSDPIQPLSKSLVTKLRKAITQAEADFSKVYKTELSRLQDTECWQKLTEPDREAILSSVGIRRLEKGSLGTDLEVLASLDRISLDSWRTSIAALPHQFSEARLKAEKKLEPKVQPVRLSSGTLHTAEDVDAWLDETRRTLHDKLKSGPVVVS